MNKKTNKTAQVLKLLTKSENNAENPLINQEFKEEIIHTRENKFISAPSKKPVIQQNPESQNDIGINVVEELVQEWLPETLKRFNCSDTDIYRAEITVEALNIIPPRYVYIKNEQDFANIKNIKEEYRQSVINTLVRLTINSKNNQKGKIIS